LEEEMAEEHWGFKKRRSCVDAIFTAQTIIDKEHNLPLFLLLIDYEKAYDKVNRHILWKMMEKNLQFTIKGNKVYL
jgi:hypothetical protein